MSYATQQVAEQLRAKCPTNHGRVKLELVQSKVDHTFRCAEARRSPAAVADLLAATVETRNDAERRVDRIIAVDRALGVDPEPRSEHVWMVGVTASSWVCDHSSDVTFRRDEIASASQEGEDAVHWLKVEAATIAGECPDQLDALFRTVTLAGQPEAATAVKAEFSRLDIT